MKCRLYVGEKKNPPKLSLVGIIWILSWFRSNKFFRSIAKCLISKQYVYLIFSLLSSWLIFLIRETPKATVRRMKLILHPWISTELLHSSCFSILNGTGQVQKLLTFNFINHRKSLTSKHKNNKRITNQNTRIWLRRSYENLARLSRYSLERRKIYLYVQICTTQTILRVIEGEKFKLCQFRN